MKRVLLIIIATTITFAASAQTIKIRTESYTPMHEARFTYSPFLGDASIFSKDNLMTVGFTGTFALSYTYRISRVAEFGATASFFASNDCTAFAAGPTMRLSWLRRANVRLYSSLTIAIPFVYEDGELISLDSPSNYLKNSLALSQFTPFGIAAGKDLLFIFEPFSFGGQGYYILLGVGYRFPVK